MRQWTALLLAACLSQACLASPVTADPPRDAAHPAAMQDLRIDSHGEAMNAVFYLASGASPHPTLLLLHGFPGNEQNLDLAQAVRRAGWNVLTLHYRGSWGSPGTFSFTHVLEDADAAVSFLQAPANAAKYRIDTGRIVVAGHSMGGFAAGWAVAHNRAVKGLVMISGADFGSITKAERTPAMLAEFQDNIIPLVGCTVPGLLGEIDANAEAWKFVHWAPALKDRPVLLLSADDGTQPAAHALAGALSAAGDRRVTELHWVTDHPYSDHRIALQTTVVKWLQQAL